jgi:hypothetical protein
MAAAKAEPTIEKRVFFMIGWEFICVIVVFFVRFACVFDGS